MLKKSVSKAAGESKPEAYPSHPPTPSYQNSSFPVGYVEDFDESRTPLTGFLSILLEKAVLLEIILINGGSQFGGKLSPFLQQAFDVFPDQI